MFIFDEKTDDSGKDYRGDIYGV